MTAPELATLAALHAHNDALRRDELPPADVAHRLERAFAPSRRLGAYGSLVPGGSNHAQLAGLAGTWSAGFVRGRVAERRYRVFTWDEAGDPIAIMMFESADLPAHWPRLDAFEGTAYRRILVPVRDAAGAVLTIANVYEGAQPG